MSHRPTRVRHSAPLFYFSLRSPYSWLAHHDLTTRYPHLAAVVSVRPFWEPDARSLQLLRKAGGTFPYTSMSRDKHLYILQDVRRLAAERGLEMTWPVDRDPVWEAPHLAYLVAADQGQGPRFMELAYRARWQEGHDICATTTLARIATQLALPPSLLTAAADSAHLRARGTAALLDVYHDGVFGVPFFIHGRHKFWGVDRLAAFAASLDGRLDASPNPVDPAPAMPPTGPASDIGHAGGCG